MVTEEYTIHDTIFNNLINKTICLDLTTLK